MNLDSLLSPPRLASLVCGIVATFPCAEAGSIAQSVAFPVTNQAVTLTVSADLLGTPISVAGPLGNSELTPDGQGLVVWTPARYGKYTLTCGDATNAIWVTARPMKFHWWSCTTAQKNVTEVMQRDAAWQPRGVNRVDWTGGDYLSDPANGGYTTAQQWYNNWTYAYDTGGMALDEMWCDDVARTNAMLQAISMVRQARGPAYSINVWSAGFGSNFAAGAANFKTNNVTVLIEDYYGSWSSHKSRWDAVRSYGLQNQAISGIWPGTTNLNNVAQLRADVALVRLAEPNANGIAMFAPTASTYTPNNLTTLLNDCDQAIEDYYLKPLIHLSVNSSAQLVAWNLGNEDAAGFSLQLLNSSGGVVQTIDLSSLVANGKQTLAIPTGAVNAKVINPAGTANLYTGNSQYSNGIYPLYVPGRYTFTNANGDHLWNTFSNWDPHGPPSGGIDGGNYAYFTNGGTNVTALAGETALSSVQFTNAGWSINGNASSQYFYTYGITSAGAGTNTINIGMSSRSAVPASFNVGQDNTVVMNGLIGAGGGDRNSGGLVKNGPGTLTVTYTNTYIGGTSINAGILAISGAGSIAASPVINIGPSATLQGGTFGSGQTVKGTGKLAGALTIGSGAILSPAGDAATGTMEITGTLVLGGTVRMQFQKSGGVLSGDRFTGIGSVTCGGTLVVNASGETLALGDSIQLFAHSGGFNNSTFASVSLPALPGGLTWDTNNLTTSGTLTVGNTLASPLFSPAGGTYYGAQSVTITGEAGSTIYYSLDGNDPTDASPHAASPVSGVNVPVDATTTLKAFARKSTMVDSPMASATYVTLGSARWNVASNGNWSDASNWLSQIVPNGPGAIVDFYSYPQSADTTVTLDGSRTIGAITFGNATPIDWAVNATGGSILTLAATATPSITVNDPITATIAAPIAGTQGLSKSGAGTLTITSANTFTGGTAINAGSLRIGGAGTLGAGTYAGTITNNGALIYASTANQSFSGNISGTGTLTHAGTGTLTLSGNNNYSGATTVNAGKLVFSKTSTSQPGPTVFTVNPGATLQINNNIASSGTWDGCGSGVTVNGGTATLGGSGTVVYYGAGNIKMTGGTLTFANNWAPYGNFRVTTQASPTTATVNGIAGYGYNPALNFVVERGTAASDLNVTLTLGGTGALNKSGTGVLTLSSACNYSGATAVSGGTLLVNGSLANTATTVAAAGSLGGSGSLAGGVTLNGTLAPGSNSIGNLTINNALTLAAGSQLAWEINNWTGTAGSGWDKATVASLNLTATAVNPITIRPKDLALANFTEAGASFVLVQTTSGITGFSADKFTVDTSGLTLPKGIWAVQQAGNNLVLAYTANPDANANGILDSWEITRFGNAAAGTNSADADADHDGICNLLEYALNCNPLAANVSPQNVDQETLADGQHLRLTVPKNPAATNLIYIVESGGALNDWSTSNTVIENNTDTELIVRDTVPMASEPSRFIRLRVQTAQ